MSPVPHILVIDDDPACLQILRRFLEKEGYQVTCAGDGHQALAQVRIRKPDLILCDWMMPGLDGTRVCQAIKTDPVLRDIFFIFLTALEKSHIGNGITLGADDFITKPVDPVEVGAKVKAGLRLAQQQQALLDQAYRDVLTSAFNRRYWDHLLEQACQGDRAFLVAMLDVDFLKRINDGWGHQVGDAFLQKLARSWSAKLQQGEVLARLGGDEFASLFHRSLPRLRRLRLQVEQELAAAFPGLPAGISFGYARFDPHQPVSVFTLMTQADRRLYRDKLRRHPS